MFFKKIIFPIFLSLLFLASCSGPKGVKLEGSLTNCAADSLRIYTLTGSDLLQVAAGPLGNGQYAFDAQIPADGFYWIGTNPRDIRTAILVRGESLTLNGQCGALQQATITKSPVNDSYAQLAQQMQLDKQRYDGMYRQLMSGRPADDNFRGQMEQLYNKMKGLTDSLQKKGSPLGKAIALDVSSTPYNPENSLYSNAVEHYAANYMPLADLSDPGYSYIPILGETAGQFTLLMTQAFAQDKNLFETYLDKFLARIPANSVAHRNVSARIIGMLEQARSESYAKYAQPYINSYPQDRNSQRMQQVIPAITQYLQQKAQADAQFATGMTPPEIELPTPKGDELRLSDLKGKVVLIDFWASWCGPCRKENPNVKKLYTKYKRKGFEILGVSLDSDKGRWVQAIDQDGLDWLHVSDLRKWQSVAAKDYAVSSIPQTFLINRDGTIIARGLRGPALERKLEEVFGES